MKREICLKKNSAMPTDIEKFLEDNGFAIVKKVNKGNNLQRVEFKCTAKNFARFIVKMRESHSFNYFYRDDTFVCCFDFLCNGERVPFVDRKKHVPQGIFPFLDSDVYFELNETGETLRSNADENRLPDKEFCERVYAVKDEINLCLKKLGYPPLTGPYFATSDYISGANWIVGFDSDAECMPADYYNNDEKAKIRYVGTLK